jgi:HEAT repeat protein
MREATVGDPERDRDAGQIRERLKGVRGQDLTDAQVAEVVRHLLAAGEPAIPVILSQFTDEDETLLAVATQALKAWGEPRPVEPLIALLRNPVVGDLAKALILNVLESYGLDVDDPELLGLGINLEEYQVDSGGDGGNGREIG